jgi:hypothetical protein
MKNHSFLTDDYKKSKSVVVLNFGPNLRSKEIISLTFS